MSWNIYRCFNSLLQNLMQLEHLTFTSINHSVLTKGGLSLHTQHSPLYPLLSLPFPILIQSIYRNVVLSSDIFFCRELSSHLPFLLEHPSAGSSFLASGTTNFFSSSLSVPASFFLLPFFLSQLHFLFCPFYTPHPSPYPHLKFFQACFAHSIVVSKSLHHTTTLHSIQSTSLASSLVVFPRVHRKCFSSC